jgi:hypothetical protein
MGRVDDAAQFKQGGLIVYVVNPGGGGGGGTSSDFDEPFPDVGTAAGFEGTNGDMLPGLLDVAGNLRARNGANSIQAQAFKNTTLAGNASTTFTATAIPAGKTGYLLQVDVASTGFALFTIQENGTDLAYKVVNSDSDVYTPPTVDSDECAATHSFDIVVTNLTPAVIQVFATMFWDEF